MPIGRERFRSPTGIVALRRAALYRLAEAGVDGGESWVVDESTIMPPCAESDSTVSGVAEVEGGIFSTFGEWAGVCARYFRPSE
mmetsp:Transcript_47678/g.111273  ORF Transcript_47678/g.111273 Transcript_47678/m.111273 type:complete len:84 (+) Transcript_47678:887-1138(+)